MSDYTAKPEKEGEEDGAWVVVGDDDEVKATHQPPDAKRKATEQCSLLEEIQNDPEWDSDDD